MPADENNTTVHAVLLVPSKGDPHGLLRRGPCLARPPIAWSPEPGRWRPIDRVNDMGWTRALVLVWDGKPVAEGLDRMRRIMRLLPAQSYGWFLPHVLKSITDFARYAPGTIVLLDADGQEMTP